VTAGNGGVDSCARSLLSEERVPRVEKNGACRGHMG
jgi:hypothetical protein